MNKKFSKIKDELNDVILERTEVIDALIMALITGQHICLLGMPGIAKTKLVKELMNHISDGKYFETLLSKLSIDDTVIGPYSIKSYKEKDIMRRNTDGKLPRANIAFLDEIFKCNEPVLNALLSIINERIFHNDVIEEVPLISLIGASNEEPEDSSLKALYDRLLFRFWIDPIQDPKNRLQMYKNHLNRTKQSTLTKITISEIKQAQEEVLKINVPDSIIEAFEQIMNDLEMHPKRPIQITDRRKNHCLDALRASAYINNRDTVSTSDFITLIPCLWDTKSDIPIVKEVILSKVDPMSHKLLDFKTQFEKLKDNYNNCENKAPGVMTLHAESKDIVAELQVLKKDCIAKGSSTLAIDQFIDDMFVYISNLFATVVNFKNVDKATFWDE